MSTERVVIATAAAVLLVVSAAWALISSSRTVLNQESLKVIVADDFPNNLECEVRVGSKAHPSFRTEGQRGQVAAATIDLDLSTSVSVRRKIGGDDSYLLFLLSEDSEGKAFALFDLNIDGQWDVKKTPTRQDTEFIWFQGRWFHVDHIEAIRGQTPTAVRGGERYEFHGTWVRGVVPGRSW